MNHSLKRRRQALHQPHHHYYLNISVEAANLLDWRIESNRNFFARIGMLYSLGGAVEAGIGARFSPPPKPPKPLIVNNILS